MLLHTTKVTVDSKDRKYFTINSAKRSVIRAASPQEAQAWTQALQKVLDAWAPDNSKPVVRTFSLEDTLNDNPGLQLFDGSIKEGFLDKRGGTLQLWRTRYFVLGPGKQLNYYKVSYLG
jgi:hypothetical protein